jgi:hypothetical protein
MYHMLAREVLRLFNKIPRDVDWEVMVDMFIYRDPSEAEKQEESTKDRLALENTNASWSTAQQQDGFGAQADEWTGGNFAAQDADEEGGQNYQ